MIYFIKAGQYTKIGYTNGELSTRIASIQTGCPFKLELLFTIDGDVDKERMLHKQFSLYRGVGEWFDIPFDLDEEIVELALQQKPSGFVKGRKVKGNTEIRCNPVKIIEDTIDLLISMNAFVTQTNVAEKTKLVSDVKLSRVTVNKHFPLFINKANSHNLSLFGTVDWKEYNKTVMLEEIGELFMQGYSPTEIQKIINERRIDKEKKLSRTTVYKYIKEVSQ